MASTGPNGHLTDVDYGALVADVKSVVARTVPPGRSVLVVSKGDAALLDLPGAHAAHFPQAPDGRYAGHHPADSAAAIAQLEALRRHGAEYLVIPATSLWWLEHYAELAGHLAAHGTVAAQEPACVVYALGTRSPAAADPPLAPASQSPDSLRDFLERLMPDEATLVAVEADGTSVGELAPLRVWRFPPSKLAEQPPERLLEELERLAGAGADYLVVPRGADAWLRERLPLAEAIERCCRKIADQRHLCRVFDLSRLREATT